MSPVQLLESGSFCRDFHSRPVDAVPDLARQVAFDLIDAEFGRAPGNEPAPAPAGGARRPVCFLSLPCLSPRRPARACLTAAGARDPRVATSLGAPVEMLAALDAAAAAGSPLVSTSGDGPAGAPRRAQLRLLGSDLDTPVSARPAAQRPESPPSA